MRFEFLADDFWLAIPTIGIGPKKIGVGWLAWHLEVSWD